MDNYVFVYGTLMSGMHNNYLIRNSEFISDAKTIEKYGLFVSIQNKIPMLFSNDRTSIIHGELYKLTDEDFQRTDWLEGHPAVYKRELIDVFIIHTHEKIKAWVYFFNQEKLTSDYYKSNCMLINDGNYRKFINT